MDISIKDITYHYGENKVLDSVDLLAEHGELLALLGPSGCGKTTLLRLVAGLIPLQKGSIYFGDVDVSHMDPRKRNAVMVFQNYALFPHMSVEKNIEYGLKVRGFSKGERDVRIEEIIGTVRLMGLRDRKISELSGGQQQRVALARALVVKPDVLLFDEPLSNLDEKLRVSMRQEIRRILKEADTTGVYVTHDQEEAMSIADRIAIMDKGIIQQFGSPKDVYEKPANKFVAEFMGECNYINMDGKTFLLRPDKISLSKAGRLSGVVDWVEYLGSMTRIRLTADGKIFLLDVPSGDLGSSVPKIGDNVKFDFKIKDTVDIKD